MIRVAWFRVEVIDGIPQCRVTPGIDVRWWISPDGSEALGKAICTDNLALLREMTTSMIEYPLDKFGNPDLTQPPIADKRPTKAGRELLEVFLSQEGIKELNSRQANRLHQDWFGKTIRIGKAVYRRQRPDGTFEDLDREE